MKKNNQTLSNDWPTYCHTGKYKTVPLHTVLYSKRCPMDTDAK